MKLEILLNRDFSLGIDWKPGNWIPYIRTGISVVVN